MIRIRIISIAVAIALLPFMAYGQDDGEAFELHENGTTIVCDSASVGETGIVEGTEYTKRSRDQITPDNAATTCTSGITDMSDLFVVEGENDNGDTVPVAHSFNEDISHWDVSDVTNMTRMFFRAEEFNQDLSAWDVSNVTTMLGMFYEARSFNQDLSSWDVGNVTNMSRMFSDADAFNQPLNSWNVSSVTNMRGMFQGAAAFNQPLNNWDVSSVADMRSMFAGAFLFSQDLSSWDITALQPEENEPEEGERNGGMNNMFTGADLTQETYGAMLQAWKSLSEEAFPEDEEDEEFPENVIFGAGNTPYAPAAHEAREHLINNYNWSFDDAGPGESDEFYSEDDTIVCLGAPLGATATVGDESYTKRSRDQITPENAANTCTSGITDMSGLFQDEPSFNADISTWDVSDVTDMSRMFFGAEEFNQDLSNWDVSSVENMSGMFFEAESFNSDIADWDVSSVTNMQGMFTAAKAFNQDIGSWDVSKVENMSRMFDSAEAFDQDLSSWNVTSVEPDLDNPIEQDRHGGMEAMFTNSNLSEASYSAILQAWADLDVNDNITLDAGTTTYTGTEEVADARQRLIDDYNWTINDGGEGGFFKDGNTIVCFGAEFGDTADIDGVTYTKRSKNEITPDNAASTCTSGITDMSELFYAGMVNDTTFAENDFNEDISHWDVSNVTNMSRMFFRATDFNQDLSDWDVSSVQNMRQMFGYAEAFNQDLSSWDVSSVRFMHSMFQNATAFDQDLSAWDVSSVENMSGMFFGASSFNQSLGDWDIRSIMPNPDDAEAPHNGMDEMLAGSGIDQVKYSSTLTGWAALAEITEIPENVTFGAGNTPYSPDAEGARNTLINTYNWTINDAGAGGTDTFYVDENGTIICLGAPMGETQEIGGTTYTKRAADDITPENAATSCTSGIIDMSGLFYAGMEAAPVEDDDDDEDAKDGSAADSVFVENTFNADISHWDVSSVTDMTRMFRAATEFNQDLSNWDVSNVENMFGMFSYAENFDGDLSNWDVGNVEDFGFMFWKAEAFNQDISDWDVSSATNMQAMFRSAESFDQPLNDWDVSSVTSMADMFSHAFDFDQPLNEWNVSSVTDMRHMFWRATSFNQDLSEWNVSNVETMTWMFRYAEAFDQPIDNWNFGNITPEPENGNKDATDGADRQLGMNEMLLGSSFSQPNYDALLNRLAGMERIPEGVELGVGETSYSPAAADARELLISQYGWTILDGELTNATEPGEQLPETFSLEQNYPNPFNPTTQIDYALPESAEVRIDVFNTLGQRVATLVNTRQNAGNYSIRFDASNLASGVYLYRLQAGSTVITQRMTLVK